MCVFYQILRDNSAIKKTDGFPLDKVGYFKLESYVRFGSQGRDPTDVLAFSNLVRICIWATY